MEIIITAIVPAYNGQAYLRRAIESILRQSRRVDEIIVVDDGSTDDTGQIVANYKDNVQYIKKENGGAATARNLGVSKAVGNWLAFLDQDDEWLPDKLKLQEAAIRDSNAVLCYGSYWFHDLNGASRLHRAILPERLWPAFRVRNQFPPSVTMIRRDVFNEFGGFSTTLGTSCEDWDLFIRAAFKYKSCLAVVSVPLINYFEMSTSQSRDPHVMAAGLFQIADSSLLIGTTGVTRWYWRRRILSAIYHQLSKMQRARGESAMANVLLSLLWCPVFSIARYKTIVLETGRLLNSFYRMVIRIRPAPRRPKSA